MNRPIYQLLLEYEIAKALHHSYETTNKGSLIEKMAKARASEALDSYEKAYLDAHGRLPVKPCA